VGLRYGFTNIEYLNGCSPSHNRPRMNSSTKPMVVGIVFVMWLMRMVWKLVNEMDSVVDRTQGVRATKESTFMSINPERN